MTIANKDKFKSSEFAIQVMARGSFIDNETGAAFPFLVEAFTIRLNHIALNAWLTSETMNVRECYATTDEWEVHKDEYEEKRRVWESQIVEALGIDPEAGGISITQAQSEVFTVVNIRKIT